MKTDFTNTLVIGVSSRALFDLEEENRIFETEHIQAYRKYLSEHEAEPLKVGTAFYLVKNLLELNKLVEIPMVEVVLMSKNSPEPIRISTLPSSWSATSASRIDGRETPSCSASVRSGGRRPLTAKSGS